MMDLPARARCTETVLARFRHAPFDWRTSNCIHLARAQAVAMGHHVPELPVIRNALGAKKALKAQGAASVTALLDLHLQRLPAPAFMWMGDLCVLRGDLEGNEVGLEAVCIADGYGNLFGWHPDKPDGLATVKLAQADIAAAWALGRD